MTYKHLLQDCKLDCLDLFVLDVEGHALNVLAGMEGSDVMPAALCIEHGHVGNAISLAVGRLVYTLVKISFNNSFYMRKAQ